MVAVRATRAQIVPHRMRTNSPINTPPNTRRTVKSNRDGLNRLLQWIHVRRDLLHRVQELRLWDLLLPPS